jgi:hypothetical protein
MRGDGRHDNDAADEAGDGRHLTETDSRPRNDECCFQRVDQDNGEMVSKLLSDVEVRL